MSSNNEGYSIVLTNYFEKKLKKLVKKYPQFKEDYFNLFKTLESNPYQGTPLKGNLRKIRINITGKSAGKSYGARIIAGIYVEGHTVYLLDLYDKSIKKDLSKNEREELSAVFEKLKRHGQN